MKIYRLMITNPDVIDNLYFKTYKDAINLLEKVRSCSIGYDIQYISLPDITVYTRLFYDDKNDLHSFTYIITPIEKDFPDDITNIYSVDEVVGIKLYNLIPREFFATKDECNEYIDSFNIGFPKNSCAVNLATIPDKDVKKYVTKMPVKCYIIKENSIN